MPAAGQTGRLLQDALARAGVRFEGRSRPPGNQGVLDAPGAPGARQV